MPELDKHSHIKDIIKLVKIKPYTIGATLNGANIEHNQIGHNQIETARYGTSKQTNIK